MINGWQTYNSYNTGVSIGASNYFRPSENLQLVANFYLGRDNRNSNLLRFHHDNSVVARYYKNKTNAGISQAAFSLNTHYGFQSGAGVSASNEFMTGASLANRVWFHRNKLAVTLRADALTNPGLYLSASPSTVTPNSFTEAIAADPRRQLTMGQATVTFDVMPSDFVTFRLEYVHRQSNVPYFAGPGGTTSPDGWANTPTAGWRPDLRKTENRIVFAMNFRL